MQWIEVSAMRFRERPGEHFHEVERHGGRLLITRRGKPIAWLLPFSEGPAEALDAIRRSRSTCPTLQAGSPSYAAVSECAAAGCEKCLRALDALNLASRVPRIRPKRKLCRGPQRATDCASYPCDACEHRERCDLSDVK